MWTGSEQGQVMNSFEQTHWRKVSTSGVSRLPLETRAIALSRVSVWVSSVG